MRRPVPSAAVAGSPRTRSRPAPARARAPGDGRPASAPRRARRGSPCTSRLGDARAEARGTAAPCRRTRARRSTRPSRKAGATNSRGPRSNARRTRRPRALERLAVDLGEQSALGEVERRHRDRLLARVLVCGRSGNSRDARERHGERKNDERADQAVAHTSSPPPGLQAPHVHSPTPGRSGHPRSPWSSPRPQASKPYESASRVALVNGPGSSTTRGGSASTRSEARSIAR